MPRAFQGHGDRQRNGYSELTSKTTTTTAPVERKRPKLRN